MVAQDVKHQHMRTGQYNAEAWVCDGGNTTSVRPTGARVSADTGEFGLVNTFVRLHPRPAQGAEL